MAVTDALTPQRARLVGEERSEAGDDRDQPDAHQVLNHILDVLVSRGSFFVEQLALFADDPATQRCLRQLVDSESLAHAQTGFTASPLTTCAVGQGPSVAFTI